MRTSFFLLLLAAGCSSPLEVRATRTADHFLRLLSHRTDRSRREACDFLSAATRARLDVLRDRAIALGAGDLHTCDLLEINDVGDHLERPTRVQREATDGSRFRLQYRRFSLQLVSQDRGQTFQVELPESAFPRTP